MGDVSSIASRMRQEDITEVLDLAGLTPSEAIQMAVKASCASYSLIRRVFVVYVKDTPEIIFGVGRSDTIGVGLPWLLGTDVIRTLPVAFTKYSRMYIKEFLKEYPILTNIVDARNEVHIAWLIRMGFKFIADYPESGPGRILARQFVLVRK